VKRWRNAEMALRWTAAGMMEAAKGFRRLEGATSSCPRSKPRCSLTTPNMRSETGLRRTARPHNFIHRQRPLAKFNNQRDIPKQKLERR
jgi:hypothetical protein